MTLQLTSSPGAAAQASLGASGLPAYLGAATTYGSPYGPVSPSMYQTAAFAQFSPGFAAGAAAPLSTVVLPPPPYAPPAPYAAPLPGASSATGASAHARPVTGNQQRGSTGRGNQQRSPYEDVLYIPSSPELVGDMSPYRQEPAPMGCYECRRNGHFGFECAARFVRILRMPPPGTRSDGSRDPSAWAGDTMVPAARRDLLLFCEDHRLTPSPLAPLRLEVLRDGRPPPLARRIRSDGRGAYRP